MKADDAKHNANLALQEAFDWTVSEDEAGELLDAIFAWFVAELDLCEDA